MGKGYSSTCKLENYKPLCTTLLEPNLPTTFGFSDHFLHTLPQRIKGYEDEFRSIGITKNSYRKNRTDLDREIFLEALDSAMTKDIFSPFTFKRPFLVNTGGEYLSFNVPITDRIICTIHPAYVGESATAGNIWSVKTKGRYYNQIRDSIQTVDMVPYSEMVKKVEEKRLEGSLRIQKRVMPLFNPAIV